MAKNWAHEMKTETNASVLQINNPCKHCGKNHNSQGCRFKNVTCFKCGNFGHVASICSAPGRNLRSPSQQLGRSTAQSPRPSVPVPWRNRQREPQSRKEEESVHWVESYNDYGGSGVREPEDGCLCSKLVSQQGRVSH